MNAALCNSRAACRRVTAPSSRAFGAVRPVVAKPVVAQRSVVAHFFKFGKNGFNAETAGIYGSQTKDDYDLDDLEQYFNYMGFLAEEGCYDRMWALSKSGLEPVDAILVLAASQDDLPKIQEILKAGANPNVKDPNGKTPRDLATKADVKKLLQEYEGKAAAV